MRYKLYIFITLIFLFILYNIYSNSNTTRCNVEYFSVGAGPNDNPAEPTPAPTATPSPSPTPAPAPAPAAAAIDTCHVMNASNCLLEKNSNCKWDSKLNVCFHTSECESYVNDLHGCNHHNDSNDDGLKCKWVKCANFQPSGIKHAQCPDNCEYTKSNDLCRPRNNDPMNDYNTCRPIYKPESSDDQPCSIKLDGSKIKFSPGHDSSKVFQNDADCFSKYNKIFQHATDTDSEINRELLTQQENIRNSLLRKSLYSINYSSDIDATSLAYDNLLEDSEYSKSYRDAFISNINASLAYLSNKDQAENASGESYEIDNFHLPQVDLNTGVCVITKPEHIIFSRGAVKIAKDMGSHEAQASITYNAHKPFINSYNKTNPDNPMYTSFYDINDPTDPDHDEFTLPKILNKKIQENDIDFLINNGAYNYTPAKHYSGNYANISALTGLGEGNNPNKQKFKEFNLNGHLQPPKEGNWLPKKTIENFWNNNVSGTNGRTLDPANSESDCNEVSGIWWSSLYDVIMYIIEKNIIMKVFGI